jgi:hypothetical protein
MSFFSNYYLYVHRPVYAIKVAIVLLGLLAWALWQTSADLVERQEFRGELVEIIGDINDPKGAIPVCIIGLDDGSRIKLALPPSPPYPRVGDKVPLIMERYSDGKKFYAFNTLQWTGDGGASP